MNDYYNRISYAYFVEKVVKIFHQLKKRSENENEYEVCL